MMSSRRVHREQLRGRLCRYGRQNGPHRRAGPKGPRVEFRSALSARQPHHDLGLPGRNSSPRDQHPTDELPPPKKV